VGQVIGDRFRLDALIGRGAMADVFRAQDGQTGNSIALKILRRPVADDAQTVQRFAREADVQAKLRHRNIAALLGTGMTAHGEPFIAVELLRGTSLRGALATTPVLPPRRAASYAWQALQGLAAVHAAGVLHRDLKPANIMLEASPGPVERVVLIDFGFATLEGAVKLTAQGAIVGSLTYIAPERLRGEITDARSDLYGMGVILYEMLAGRPPFVAENEYDLVAAHLDHAPPALPAAIPASLQTICAYSLAKHPGERYPTATDMAAALELASRELG
jgi:serine/threonine-protein kinase